jgi:hypothetical protein
MKNQSALSLVAFDCVVNCGGWFFVSKAKQLSNKPTIALATIPFSSRYGATVHVVAPLSELNPGGKPSGLIMDAR